MKPEDYETPEALARVVTARAYQDLAEHSPLLGQLMQTRARSGERTAFEAGIAAGFKVAVEMFSEEEAEPDAT